MNFISYFRRHTSFAYTKEFKVQLKLFIPFLLGQLCSCLMGTVDMLMAGLAGTEDISGVAVAIISPMISLLPVDCQNAFGKH